LVEVKHVDLPDSMKRAMAKQAESERERRAKVIHAEGEFQAASKLRDAAETFEGHPMAMQMRFLQTLVEVGAENNTTIVFPVPLERSRWNWRRSRISKPCFRTARSAPCRRSARSTV
jgi:regulator of protease activity HflC (stomatin/prohibitin superfamily)